MNQTLTKLALIGLILGSATTNECMDTTLSFAEDKNVICKQLLIELIRSSFSGMTATMNSHFDFQCDKEILPVLEFALQANSVFKTCKFNAGQMFTAFLKGIRNEKFDQSLNIHQLLELASILDKYFFEDAILDAICYIIAQQTGDVELRIDSTNCPEKVLIKIVHYYFIFHKQILPGQTSRVTTQALSFKESEVSNSFNLENEGPSFSRPTMTCKCSDTASLTSSNIKSVIEHIKEKHPERVTFEYCEYDDCKCPVVMHTVKTKHDAHYHSKTQ